MTYSQKYCLVHFINNVDVSTQFTMTSWPPHITLADVFSIDRQNSDINSKLQTLCSKQLSVTINVASTSTLGTTPVFLFTNSAQLQHLHETIITLLEENGALFNTPEFTKKGFIAHSTIQTNTPLKTNDAVTINSLSFVDMFANNDWKQRRVLATFRLQA